MRYINYPVTIKMHLQDGTLVDVEGVVEVPYSTANLQAAQQESIDPARIEIVDDGIPENPTALDRIEAQTMYTAMMTGTLMEVESNV